MAGDRPAADRATTTTAAGDLNAVTEIRRAFWSLWVSSRLAWVS
jgi:hypothetical protein